MTIFEIMNYFWFSNENEPCSLSEIALHHYLFFEANRQHWAMPFRVSTQMIQARLNTSKQNVMKAREGLAKKGLISFSKGEGKGKPALYTLLLGTSADKADTQPLTHMLPQSLTQKLSQPLANEVTQMLPHTNIKEENTKNVEKKECVITPTPSPTKVVLTLPLLREKLLNDESWLLDLSKRLSEVGIILALDGLKGKINNFFDELKGKGETEREESDCRKYVFNWIKYHNNRTNNYGQDSRSESKGGRAEISANRPEDYKGSC